MSGKEKGKCFIDRKRLVRRHNPVITDVDNYASMTVGNGEFAYTVDATGLQTFPEYAREVVPLGTMSNWGWHTEQNPKNYSVEKFPLTYYDTHGRLVGYPYWPWMENLTEEVEWLRGNPHKMHLGMIGFRLTDSSGKQASIKDLTDIRQTLDLWEGILTSRFKYLGEEVIVRTLCHPDMDMISIHVESTLLRKGNVKISIHFPYGSYHKEGADWNSPDKHSTEIIMLENDRIILHRKLDQDEYFVSAQWTSEATLVRESEHLFVLDASGKSSSITFQCNFSPKRGYKKLPSHEESEVACMRYWEHFWNSGGVVDLQESTDPRAKELERRIVLSQYLTAIQSSGSLPPQESGLIHNSWSGKFHLEMYWWHNAHFALWGRPQMLEKSFSWYLTIIEKAKELAKSQGYSGARWPKCVGPEGINAPCFIEPFLVWQQPHPIYLANLLYRLTNDESILEKYADIVFETAEFMASFVVWKEERKEYVMGPPVAPAQERYPHATTFNPTFELAYWHYGLETAQKWREELGMKRNEKWDHVLNNLSPLPVVDGVYVAAESAPDTYTNPRYIQDHPTMVAPLGILPGNMVDITTMKRTFTKVLEVWDWKSTWGWDYPMLAMTAARLGETEKAIDILLMETQKNRYLPNGNCYQHDGLPVYLPGNGGLLTAVAMMAAGWDNGPDSHAPGFPANGKWTVRHEALAPMP